METNQEARNGVQTIRVTITDIKGDKQKIKVTPSNTIREVKASLYRAGKITPAFSLWRDQTELKDQETVSHYNITEGADINILYKPEETIRLRVICGYNIRQTEVVNSTSALALKVQLCDEINNAPEEIDLEFEGTTLAGDLPLHFYGIENGSALVLIRPYVSVTIEDNHGDILYTRINRADTIKQVKNQITSTCGSRSPEPPEEVMRERTTKSDTGYVVCTIGEHRKEQCASAAKHPSTSDMRLYLVTAATGEYRELRDDLTVKKQEIQDGDKLYLLTYTWTRSKTITCEVYSNRLLNNPAQLRQGHIPNHTPNGLAWANGDISERANILEVSVDDRMTSSDALRWQVSSNIVPPVPIHGVSGNDTLKSIGVRVQDQTGIPVHQVGLADDLFKDEPDDMVVISSIPGVAYPLQIRLTDGTTNLPEPEPSQEPLEIPPEVDAKPARRAVFNPFRQIKK